MSRSTPGNHRLVTLAAHRRVGGYGCENVLGAPAARSCRLGDWEGRAGNAAGTARPWARRRASAALGPNLGPTVISARLYQSWRVGLDLGILGVPDLDGKPVAAQGGGTQKWGQVAQRAAGIPCAGVAALQRPGSVMERR